MPGDATGGATGGAAHAEDVEALTHGHAVVPVDRTVLRLDGPDATSYLQGQLSQDVAALAVGGSALTFLLEPQGRVVALGRLCRTGDDAYLFDVDPVVAEPTLTRLQRFRLRAKVDIEATGLRVLSVLGAARGDRPTDVAGATVVGSAWPRLPGWDLFVDGDADPDPGTARRCDPAAWETVRVAAAVPVARDLDERVIPAETGLLEVAASFTKGCYTGQELVGRMDARGNRAPRRLRVVTGDGPAPEAGVDVLTDAGKRVGALTSITADARGNGWLGLGLLGRAVDDAGGLSVSGAPVRMVDPA